MITLRAGRSLASLQLVRAFFGWLCLAIGLIAAASLLGRGELKPDSALPVAADTGARLPAFILTGLDGAASDFRDYAGRGVVLNVWATWCAPCRAELPSLQRLSERLDPARFAVVAVSVDEDPDFVREYLRDLGLGLDVYIDKDRSVTRGLLGVVSLPQTLLVRDDGSLDRRVEGLTDWSLPENQELAQALWRSARSRRDTRRMP